MKKLLFIGLCFAAVNTNAQYFQRYHNFATTLPTSLMSRSEQFYSGLASRVNYSTPGNTFYVGVGVSYNDNLAMTTNVADRARFVRTPANGNANQNFGYEFGPTAAQVYNSNFRSIAERNLTGGTGGYYACGQVTDNAITLAATIGGSDALFARVSSGGAIVAGASEFALDLGGGFDVATCIRPSVITSAGLGTYIACGYTDIKQATGVIPHSDCWVARIKVGGAVMWAKRYQFDPAAPLNSAVCIANSLTEDALGNIYVVGSVRDNAPSTGNDGLYFKLNSAGAPIAAMRKRYDIGFDDQFQSIKPTADGNFIIGGFTHGNSSSTQYNMLIVKITPALAIIWDNILTATDAGGNPIESKCYDIMERINTSAVAEYYLTGPSNIAGTIVKNTHVIKADVLGNGVDNWQYAPLTYDYGFGIDFNPNLGATLTGPVVFSNQVGNTFTGGYASSYLLKTAFNGVACVSPLAINVPPSSATGAAIFALPVAQPVFTRVVTPVFSVSFNYAKALTCNPFATVPAAFNARLSDENISDISIYPSPAYDFINIELPESEIAQSTLTVFDVLGNQVMNMVINTNESSHVDVSKFKSGMYFMVVKNEERTYKTKFLKQ